jgi:hypothetical protein
VSLLPSLSLRKDGEQQKSDGMQARTLVAHAVLNYFLSYVLCLYWLPFSSPVLVEFALLLNLFLLVFVTQAFHLATRVRGATWKLARYHIPGNSYGSSELGGPVRRANKVAEILGFARGRFFILNCKRRNILYLL